MTVPSSTIITMFFNLKKLKDSTELTRPFDFYLKNSVHVLKLNYPMIIFCDEDTYEPLKNIRDSEVVDNNTKYIVKNIENYEYYQECMNIITKNRNKNGKPIDNRNTASYFLTVMFKVFAFNYAHNHNFFNTTHYAWIDIGCNHHVKELSTYAPLMLNNPSSKVSCCYIHYHGSNELRNMKEYMKYGGPCGIAATTITIEADYVHRFYLAMFSIFYEHLYHETGHTEETVMTYCYDRYPEIFNIYGGDYGSVFVNYHNPTQDINTIVSCFIQNAVANNNISIAAKMSKQIIDSNENLDANLVGYLQHVADMNV
jgi:hypothetical protein